MIAGSPASTSAASGSLGVDTINSPFGNRWASSPCKRAIPPPMGGKSCANNMVVIARVPGEAGAWACRMLTGSVVSEQSASGPAELPVDADQVRRDPVPVVVRLHGRPPGGARPSTEPLVAGRRSEEHTSELQSRLHLVCRLLLEKKKKTYT